MNEEIEKYKGYVIRKFPSDSYIAIPEDVNCVYIPSKEDIKSHIAEVKKMMRMTPSELKAKIESLKMEKKGLPSGFMEAENYSGFNQAVDENNARVIKLLEELKHEN